MTDMCECGEVIPLGKTNFERHLSGRRHNNAVIRKNQVIEMKLAEKANRVVQIDNTKAELARVQKWVEEARESLRLLAVEKESQIAQSQLASKEILAKAVSQADAILADARIKAGNIQSNYELALKEAVSKAKKIVEDAEVEAKNIVNQASLSRAKADSFLRSSGYQNLDKIISIVSEFDTVHYSYDKDRLTKAIQKIQELVK